MESVSQALKHPAQPFNRAAQPAVDPGAVHNGKKQKKPLILVPFDGSAGATEAARFGLRVASRTDGQILLLHAINLNLDPCGPADVPRLKASLGEEALAQAEPIMVSAQATGVTATCAIEEGAPAVVIAKAAERWEPDLVVMAARRRGFFGRWFRRRTTEQTIAGIQCPVLVVQDR